MPRPTTGWVRRIGVYRKRVERLDKATGEVKTQWAKAVACADAHARAAVGPRLNPSASTARAVDRADYDDSNEALAEAAESHGLLKAEDVFGGRRRRVQ